jgi:hypothetical protein
MGQQYNKTEKRRRRQAYLDRKKEKAKASGIKKTAKRPARKKADAPA